MNAISELLLTYGLTVVFLNVLLDQLGVPLPAVPTLIVVGALAAQGKISGWAALALGILGSMTGDTLWYALGRYQGRRFLDLLSRLSASSIDGARRMERLSQRWGSWALVVAKFIPGVATVAPPLAGASGVSFVRLLLFSFVGSLLWAGCSVLAGVAFSGGVDLLLEGFSGFQTRVTIVVVSALVGYIVFRLWKVARLRFAARLVRGNR
jgi:membrane protein DedA with SNARE-associated domain